MNLFIHVHKGTVFGKGEQHCTVVYRFQVLEVLVDVIQEILMTTGSPTGGDGKYVKVLPAISITGWLKGPDNWDTVTYPIGSWYTHGDRLCRLSWLSSSFQRV